MNLHVVDGRNDFKCLNNVTEVTKLPYKAARTEWTVSIFTE